MNNSHLFCSIPRSISSKGNCARACNSALHNISNTYAIHAFHNVYKYTPAAPRKFIFFQKLRSFIQTQFSFVYCLDLLPK